MKTKLLFLLMTLVPAALISCNDQAGKTEEKTEPKATAIREEAVAYKDDTTSLNGYVTFDENIEGKRPVVLVVHEWWGLTEYPRMRAKQLAEMGYLAMAVDMYGNGKMGPDPEKAGALAGPFYSNPQMIRSRIDAALAKIMTYPQADTSNMAAIGYCFGGTIVLNAAKMGEPFKGVVSFHGDLRGVPADKNLLKAKILVCHGNADSFVPQEQVDAFKKQMDSIGADYTFKVYDSATHAFTNPKATDMGKQFNLPIKYDPAADKQSWEDMKTFFGRVFTTNNSAIKK
jgi:dienelactone hydrolase